MRAALGGLLLMREIVLLADGVFSSAVDTVKYTPAGARRGFSTQLRKRDAGPSAELVDSDAAFQQTRQLRAHQRHQKGPLEGPGTAPAQWPVRHGSSNCQL